ncbi:tetratricopeptide repeat protein [Alteromonas sp. H39]|uniref:tetratricopeptide repeat protein n=1 Tax=Alteromonas sp. H39 TaxID=3389876 RepID=UPI0039E0A53D
MSVVNKMLKDLEAREGDEKSHANYQPPVKKSPRLRFWVYGLIIAAVVVIAFALLTVPEKTPEPQPVASVTPVAEPENTEAGNPPVAEKPAAKTVSDKPPEKKKGSLLTRPINELVAEARGEKPATSDTNSQSASEGSMRAVAEPVNETTETQVVSAAEESAVTRFELTSEENTDKPLQNLRERIRLALAKPQKGEAIALMRELIDAEPENIAVRKKLSAILFAEGQVGNARDMLIKTLAMKPSDHSVRLMLARLYVQQGQVDAAAAVLADADRFLPVTTDLLAFRAVAAQERGDYPRALSDYNQLAAMSPEQARWWLGVGTSADKLGQQEVAKKAYQQALSLGQLSRDVQQFMSQRVSVLSGGVNE